MLKLNLSYQTFQKKLLQKSNKNIAFALNRVENIDLLFLIGSHVLLPEL